MPNQIRNKLSDPLLHEFSPTDIFINIEDGRLLFRSKNQLFIVNAVISGSQEFLQGVTNPNDNSIGVLDTTGGNNTFTSFTNFTFDGTNFLVGTTDDSVTTTFTGPTEVIGNITASGNISSSGTFTGNEVNIIGNITASGNISASGTIFANNFQSTGGDVNGISFTDEVNITGNITASGGITASGDIIIDNDKMFGSKHPTTHDELSIATIDQSTGQTRTIIGNTNIGTTIQSNAGPNPAIDLNAQGGIVTISGSNFLVDTVGNITASGNISASGLGPHFFSGDVHIGNEATNTRDLHVSNDIFVADDVIISGSIKIRQNIEGNQGTGVPGSDLLNFDKVQCDEIEFTRKTTTGIRMFESEGIIDDQMEFKVDDVVFLTLKEDSSQDTFNVNPSSVDIDFQVEGTSDGNAIYMQASSDRVGIGTNTPEEKLHVNGNIKATNITASNISASGHISASTFIGNFNSAGGSIIDPNLGTTEVVFINPSTTGQLDSNGGFRFANPVLIVPRISASSTTTPGIKCKDLEIDDIIQHAGDTETNMQFGSEFVEFRCANNRMMQMNNNSSDSLFHINLANTDINFRYDGDTNDNVIFADAGTERVGIGTGTPQAKLHIEGDITASGNITGSGLRLGGNAGGTTLGLNSKKAPLGVYHATENVLGIFQSGDSQALIEFRDNSTGGLNVIGCEDEDIIVRTSQGVVKFLLMNENVQALLVSSSLAGGTSDKESRVGINVNPSSNNFSSELYVSGSISASNDITCDTLTVSNFTPLSIATNTISATQITATTTPTSIIATGNVSASGDIFGDEGRFERNVWIGVAPAGSLISDSTSPRLRFGNPNTGDLNIDWEGGQLLFRYDTTTVAAFSPQGDISASGFISASGGITSSVIHAGVGSFTIKNDNNDAFFFANAAGTAAEVNGTFTADSITVEDGLFHEADSDTSIRFGSDNMTFRCGNRRWLTSFENDSDQDIIRFNIDNNNFDVAMDGDNNDNVFYLDASEDKIGINTSTPSHELQVVGNISSSRAFFSSVQATNDYILDVKNESNVTNTDMVAIRTNVNNPGSFQSFIAFFDAGSTTVPIDRMQGDGSGGVFFTGEAAGATSDMRNKQNIVYLKDNYDATNILNQIDVLEYELKSDTNPIKEKRVGFSAQQLLELWPYPVTTFDSDNEKTGAKPGDSDFRYHKVNSGQLTPLIVKTLQEQQKVIEELKLEIDKLKNKCQE